MTGVIFFFFCSSFNKPTAKFFGHHHYFIRRYRLRGFFYYFSEPRLQQSAWEPLPVNEVHIVKHNIIQLRVERI